MIYEYKQNSLFFSYITTVGDQFYLDEQDKSSDIEQQPSFGTNCLSYVLNRFS